MRTWMSGFETNDLSIFDIHQGGLGIVQGGVSGRPTPPYGQYMMEGSGFFNGTGTIATFRKPDQSVNAISEVFFRIRMWSTGAQDFIYLKSPNDVLQVGIRQVAGNWIQVFRGDGTVLATASSGIMTGSVWHVLEGHVLCADSGGVFEAKVDGVQVISYTGDTRNDGASALMDRFASVHAASNYSDDYAFNDTDNSDGAGNNSWIGDSGIGAKVVTGAGDVTTLSGAVGSGTHWQNVDEVPPSDADYNYDDAVVGTNHYDLYALSTLANVGTVKAICTRARAWKDAAGTGNFRFVHKTGGTEYRDAADIPLLTSPYPFPQIREINPNTGVPWTSADLAALQAGFDAR